MTLFEMTGELTQLWEMLEEGEYDEDMLIDTMEAVEGEFGEKAEKWAKVIKQMEFDAQNMKKMAEEFTRKKEVLENGVKRMKDRLLLMMEAANIPEVKGEIFTIKPRKAGGVKPLIIDTDVKAEELPFEFQKVEIKVDNSAVRAALDEGKELDFAHYGERGTYLSIK